MKCPIDHVDLVMSERQGIEIDYCPKCRGVWLDRGELDKIIERASDDDRPPAFEHPPRPREEPRYGRDDKRYSDRDRGPYKKKKRSLLDDIFDF